MNAKAWSHRWFKKHMSEDIYEFSRARYQPVVNRYLSEIKGTILDAACGYGNFLWDREAIRCSRSVGLDIDAEAIRKNQIHNEFINQDMRDLLRRDAFEGILSVYTWEHLEDPDKVLRNFFEALTPGGILVIVGASRWHYISMFERALPRSLKDVAWRLLKGIPHMPYPAYYRLCTKRSILPWIRTF